MVVVMMVVVMVMVMRRWRIGGKCAHTHRSEHCGDE